MDALSPPPSIATRTKQLASAFTAAAASAVPQLPPGADAEAQLRAALQVALASRDAAMLELSDVVEHNKQLLRLLRDAGASMETTVFFSREQQQQQQQHQHQQHQQHQQQQATYGAELLARRQAIATASARAARQAAGTPAAGAAAASAAAAAEAAAAAAAAASPAPGVPAGSAEEEAQQLQAAINLLLLRLRELRWRELVLQADISGACAAEPAHDYRASGPPLNSLPPSLSNRAPQRTRARRLYGHLAALSVAVRVPGAPGELAARGPPHGAQVRGAGGRGGGDGRHAR